MADRARATARERRVLPGCRRVVIKLGSNALAEVPDMFDRVASEVSAARRRAKKRHREVVLVSSGAIALGVEHLAMSRRPTEMPALQAAAAAGQSLLMHRYELAFGVHGIAVAQVLLTHADLAQRARANNARAAIEKLLELGAVPIINENDAVAVDEIRFGDNDALAAMVAPLCSADLVLLLSDVDGLIDRTGARVPSVPTIDDDVLSLVTHGKSSTGTGGMKSKLEAARIATLAGAHVVIASAHVDNVVGRVLAGEDVGTLFPARVERMKHRKHWIAYTLRPRGAAIVDRGAAEAIRHGGRSILCVGVIGVRGSFVPGDAIAVHTAEGGEIARGLARLSASDAARLAGAPKPVGSELLVHRDDLVVLPDR